MSRTHGSSKPDAFSTIKFWSVRAFYKSNLIPYMKVSICFKTNFIHPLPRCSNCLEGRATVLRATSNWYCFILHFVFLHMKKHPWWYSFPSVYFIIKLHHLIGSCNRNVCFPSCVWCRSEQDNVWNGSAVGKLLKGPSGIWNIFWYYEHWPLTVLWKLFIF